jgi:hypothetical protein
VFLRLSFWLWHSVRSNFAIQRPKPRDDGFGHFWKIFKTVNYYAVSNTFPYCS